MKIKIPQLSGKPAQVDTLWIEAIFTLFSLFVLLLLLWWRTICLPVCRIKFVLMFILGELFNRIIFAYVERVREHAIENENGH